MILVAMTIQVMVTVTVSATATAATARPAAAVPTGPTIPTIRAGPRTRKPAVGPTVTKRADPTKIVQKAIIAAATALVSKIRLMVM